MKKTLITSISLPEAQATLWRKNKRDIMQFAERYLNIQMRKQVRREVTRHYNRQPDQKFVITTTRFSPAEYDTFHYLAAALRVSVSSLIYGLIKLWEKPSRRAMNRFFETNYYHVVETWDTAAGILEEYLTFWRLPGPDREGTPPWEEFMARILPTSK